MAEVRKLSAYIPATREVLLAAGAVEPTPEERAEMAEAYAKQQDYDERLAAWTASLADLTDPVASAVLEIHYPSASGYCPTCDDWPCETADAVTATIGHPSPSY
jgi:hypothetical protein